MMVRRGADRAGDPVQDGTGDALKIVLFVLLALLVGGGVAVAMFPMSMAAEFAASNVPDFRYAQASGSVWDGKLTNVSYGAQKIGDLSVKAELFKLLTGKAGGKLGLTREGFLGEAGIDYAIAGGGVELSNLKLSGKAGMVPGMPPVVAAGGGDFTLDVKDLKFSGNTCESASGEVWTDALAKVNLKGWVGPELRGPIACKDGKLLVEATGRSPTGEDVVARMSISPQLEMDLTATVLNAQGSAAKALTDIGFVPEGNALVMRQAMGSR
jgi:general secretion pathway protein N